MPDAGKPAFTEEECDAVREWVRGGGSLLLIADHAPFGAAAEIMARRFDVDMSKGHTSDPANHDVETGNMSFLVFTRESKLIADHPITRGRDSSERADHIITFTGQSLKGPNGSVALLKLADTALDVTRPEPIPSKPRRSFACLTEFSFLSARESELPLPAPGRKPFSDSRRMSFQSLRKKSRQP